MCYNIEKQGGDCNGFSILNRKDVTVFMSKKILKYIRDYDNDKPILTKDLYQAFPEIEKGSIRQILKRLYDKKEIYRAKPGVYFKPNPNRIMSSEILGTNKIIKEKYLENDDEVAGYISGLNFANQIGLTTQTASVDTIVSNNVSNKKRKISINKGKIIINAPRIRVNDENYKLLQILDLMNDFENLSEINLSEATLKIASYLKDLRLDKNQIDQCVEAYPLVAQVNFYKSGVQYELTGK